MASSSSVVLPASFVTSKVTFSQPRVLDSGGKQAFVNYDGGMFIMQTPSSTLPYGMSMFDKAGPIKYSVELSMRGYDEAGNKIKPFYDAMASLDEYMIDQGVKNSRQWFKSDLPRDVIKAFYSPLIRFSVDKEGNRKPYPPTFKVQLRQRNNEFETKMYDDNKQAYNGIPMEELLVKGAQVTALIQCTGVWFAGSKFGLTWKATQIRVDNLPQTARGFTFVDDGEDEVVAKPSTVSKSKVIAAVEDDSEEEEEDDEAFKAPPPSSKAKTPAPPPPVQEEESEEEEDVEPVVVPKKPATVVRKKIVAKK